jgi:chaperone modulatory protein CbpM
MDRASFLREARVGPEVLTAWIEAGWLMPRHSFGGEEFAPVDLARARFVGDLRDDIGVNDEAVTVVLNLVDQIHGLRRVLRSLLASLSAQPEAVRRNIATHAKAAAAGARGRDDAEV